MVAFRPVIAVRAAYLKSARVSSAAGYELVVDFGVAAGAAGVEAGVGPLLLSAAGAFVSVFVSDFVSGFASSLFSAAEELDFEA